MNAAANHDADSARLAIAEQVAVVTTLLRLLDPSSPFQPIIVGSIDLVAWQAFFGEAVEKIETLLPRAIRPLPKPVREKLTADASLLFSLAHRVCDTPQVCMSEAAVELDLQGVLPEITGLDPDPTWTPEEESLVASAREKSGEFSEQSARQRKVLRENLDAAAQQLIRSLTRKNGLLWLLRKRAKTSKEFATKYQGLIDQLESAVSAPLPSPKALWHEARGWFRRLANAIEFFALPELDSVLKDAAPRTRTTTTSRSGPAIPTRQSIKDSFLRSWDTFAQAYTASRHVAESQDAHPLWILFSGLVASFSACLKQTGLLAAATQPMQSPPRLIDAIATLNERIISRRLLTDWNELFDSADVYTWQIVLAAIHHLDRPDDEADVTSAHSVIFSFSEQTASRWFSRGDYPGAIVEREASKSFSAEKRRTRRELEDLRRHRAAFHGRRHWTPLPKKTSSTERQWTLNPLLAALAGIKQEANSRPLSALGDTLSRGDRPRPRRRNRRAPRKR